MKEKNKLFLQMSILFLIVFVTFGVIIVNDKTSFLMIPKVEEKINNYLTEKYKEELGEFHKEDVQYNQLKFQQKIISNKNENLYFYIYYQNKKITDTYQEDYVEGNSIFSFLKKEITSNIEKKTKENYQITLTDTLDTYSKDMQEKIVKSTEPETLSIYNLESQLEIDYFTPSKITKKISNFIEGLENKNITPKSYCFILSNKKKKLEISNITKELIESNELESLISDIINNKKSNLVDIYQITYKYLN